MRLLIQALPALFVLFCLASCVQVPRERLSDDSVLTAGVPENLFVGRLVFVDKSNATAVLETAPGLGPVFFNGDRLVVRDKNLESVALLKAVVLTPGCVTLEILAGTPELSQDVVKPSSNFLEETEKKFLNSSQE